MFVSKNLNEPIYQQLYQSLKTLIGGDEFPVGTKFLSERQIADRFEVSRPTANKVLSSLMTEQLLTYKKGVGTFVQEPVLSYEMRDLVSFTEKALAAGKKPSTQILDFKTMSVKDVTEDIESLQLNDDQTLYYIERLRLADEQAMIFEERYVPAAFCPNLKKRDVEYSLYALWTDVYQLQIAGADQRIRAIVADKRIAKHLQIQQGAACFQVLCTGYVASGEALWWERTTYRGDDYELISRIGNQDDGTPVQGVLR